jgi:hypothetical protein
MRCPRLGGMVDTETADHVRDGIPLCGDVCVAGYDHDRADQKRRESLRRYRIGGQQIGSIPA